MEENKKNLISDECYLSTNKIYIKVPSSYDFKTNKLIFLSIKLLEIFDIIIENPKEGIC